MALIRRKNFAIVLGARPNFIKAAPFFREAKKHPDYNFTLIHTGQHFDNSMSKVFFDKLDLPVPDIALNIKSEFHTEKIGKMFWALNKIFSERKFDGVIVFGDVNSTLAGAITAAKNNVRLIHIEAGLRSHDRRMPEEINRVITDHLSDLLFTTEPSAAENLIKEGIEENKIKYVGNIMIESLEIFKNEIDRSDILGILKLIPQKYAIATIHRQENTDDAEKLGDILQMLNDINDHIPVVFPLHPGTANKINTFGLKNLLENLKVIAPQGYFEFMKLITESKGVITDSGGIQEETSHLGIPCCTLRDSTERPITLTMGSNKLFKLDSASADGIKEHLLRTDFKSKHIPLWDSNVSARIFEFL